MTIDYGKLNMSSLYLLADMFADTAHRAVGQLRKYTLEPYIVHPRAVAKACLNLYPENEILASAAVLHDVLEDTKITYVHLAQVFGNPIADLVLQVTNIAEGTGLNRAGRNELNNQHLSQASHWAHTLKCFDIADNVPSIVQSDEQFGRVYIAEKVEQLAVLDKAHPVALQQAANAIYAAQEALVQKSLGGTHG
jgi:guanosine-3',5'-bis(diphosphate) 3'-pyrophosphohydrolase